MKINTSAAITGKIDENFCRNIIKICSQLSTIHAEYDSTPLSIDVQVRDDVPSNLAVPGRSDIGVQIPHEGLLHNTAYVFIKHKAENPEEDLKVAVNLAITVLERNLYTSTIRPSDGADIHIYNKRAFSTTYFEPHEYPWFVEAEAKAKAQES